MFSVLASYEKSAKGTDGMGVLGGRLEGHLDDLMDQFQQYMNAKNLEPKVREWLKGTYIDGSGKLIRRGT
jgi:hypothetical protein